MGTPSFLWNFMKSITGGLIALTISDRYASIVSVHGLSMHHTFNSSTNSVLRSLSDDYVLVEKFCLANYKFTGGDVIVFRSPNNHKEKHIKRIIAMPGEWIKVPHSHDMLKIPEGHCWVEGDNSASSLDSRSFGPVSLGLVQGKVTHIVWPPQRVGQVRRSIPEGRFSF
ncbi:PREDICTED: mitochondrial inner membrane protease subunit 2 [Nelumbo nucifera]|uniref:Mitochondrial inner membrane protease subunit 2 n=1 Tax=Nelumbo nucifera TaxID=4432 RepID=A0A1U8B4U7_NELNU|nr:PREDICTED: mitochondrial inner membrane protease subunit 2 [Nelumbo nucifera]XP_010275867.1 PREDICTED: mitochondrial inner membrane protease subunit 2 [Nelumbo nucifera]XP_010275868.1 PREDICTED: mitochondrial inner membrane protease subunit 2 [Nelumbo nucifera]XP_010275869.1 PREDICTED: mitochondrial inner membrane protease subunit 2 [Nelumbo nucifera]XP_010275870.1 PREDICTED: mitochondrial inner membrane protease subunit 2 [Nelumbo nucifera]